MTEESKILDRRTTKTRSDIFGQLRSKGHGNVAREIGIAESTFSEWIKTHGDRIAQLLTALGRKTVPIESVCYTPEHRAALDFFAKRGMAQGDDDEVTQIDWSDVK